MFSFNHKFNLLGCMARSHDSYHINNNIIHLIMSGLYVGKLPDFENLSNFNSNIEKKILIIKIVNSLDKDICEPNQNLSKNVKLFTYSVGYILRDFGSSNSLENLLQELFGSRYQTKKPNVKKNLIADNNLSLYKQGNVFFVFENLYWYNVKHIFNKMNISISGGSLSKRHLLSVTQLNLILFLSELKFTSPEIFNFTENTYLSKKIYKEIQNSRSDNIYKFKFIEDLYVLTIEELLNSMTELNILIIYFEAELIYLNNNMLSSATKNNRNSAKSSEYKVTKITNNLSELRSIFTIYSKFFIFIINSWDKTTDYNNPMVDREIIERFGFDLYFERLQFIGFPLLKLMLSVYSCLYERRQNLIFNNNYYKYVNLILNQKLPSSKGIGYDISSIFENENSDSSNNS